MLRTNSQELVDGLKSGEDSAKEFQGKTDEFSDKVGKSWQEAFNLTKVAAAALSVEGFKKLIEVANEMVNEFAADERAELLFNAALESSSSAIPHNREELEKLTASFSTMTGTSLEASKGMVAMLIATGRTDDQIRDMLKAAPGLANALGTDLKGALTQLDASFSGNIGRMGRLTPALNELTEDQRKHGDAVQIVLEKYGGLSDALQYSSDVSIKNSKNAWKEVEAALGGVIESGIKPARDASTLLAKALVDDTSMSHQFAVGMKDAGKVMLDIGMANWPGVIKDFGTWLDWASGKSLKLAYALRESIAAASDASKADKIRASQAAIAAQTLLDLEAARKKAAEEADVAAKAASDADLNYDTEYANKRWKAWEDYYKKLEAAAKAETEWEAQCDRTNSASDSARHAQGITAAAAYQDRLKAMAKSAQDYYTSLDAKHAADEKAAAAKTEQQWKDAYTSIVASVTSAAASLTKLWDNQLAAAEAIIDKELTAQETALDAEMAAELAAAGLSNETQKQKLEDQLAAAKASGDAATIKAAQDALDKYNIEEKYAEMKTQLETDAANKKAQLEYDTQHAEWEVQLAMAAANAAMAIIQCYAQMGPVAGTVAALIVGAATAVEIAAIAAAEPVLQTFSTGGDFVVPPGYPDDSYTIGVQSGEHVQVTPAGQGGVSDGTPLQVTLQLDGSVLGKWLQKATKNQEVVIHAGAIV